MKTDKNSQGAIDWIQAHGPAFVVVLIVAIVTWFVSSFVGAVL